MNELEKQRKMKPTLSLTILILSAIIVIATIGWVTYLIALGSVPSAIAFFLISTMIFVMIVLKLGGEE